MQESTKVPSGEWRNSKPATKQAEAVVMIAKIKNPELELDYSDVMENWTAGDCSDYIGNKGDGSLYKLKERKDDDS